MANAGIRLGLDRDFAGAAERWRFAVAFTLVN
jgi:hypothetical protein